MVRLEVSPRPLVPAGTLQPLLAGTPVGTVRDRQAQDWGRTSWSTAEAKSGLRRSLTLAAAAGHCPAATEPAQRRPAAPVRRDGGGQARKHPGGAEAPTRTPPPASEPPAAPTDSIDWTPADTAVCAAGGGLGDPEVGAV